MSKADILRVPDYLEHILEAIRRIHSYVEDVDEVGFLSDQKTQDAVIRNFEVIGEASNNIRKHHPEFFKANAAIPLGPAYEMRNALTHGYFKIDLSTVWNTIHDDFQELARQIEAVLARDYPGDI
jgi:uncharacterized protein with HEPN domain